MGKLKDILAWTVVSSTCISILSLLGYVIYEGYPSSVDFILFIVVGLVIISIVQSAFQYILNKE